VCSRATSIVASTAGSPEARSENARIDSATARLDEFALAVAWASARSWSAIASRMRPAIIKHIA